MDASLGSRTCRFLGRMTVVGAVTLGVPLVLPGAADAGAKGHWDRVAKCVSGGNWGTSTGNGYYGGLQFSKATWKAYGGQGMPHKASRAQQIKIAEKVLKKQGWRAWPACSRKLGLR